jgi:hypothetical protein
MGWRPETSVDREFRETRMIDLTPSDNELKRFSASG